MATQNVQDMAGPLDADGYLPLQAILTASECDAAAARAAPFANDPRGARNLLDAADCQALAATLRDHPALRPFLAGRVAVQCTLFDKSPAANWLVPLHQDLSVPVRERVSHPDCRGWSTKDGVRYVQPPLELLESLLAVRVHLDECGPDNGPLRVVPGSHRRGRLSAEAARKLRDERDEVPCPITRGGVLLMRPLLLHASSKASSPAQRRVLHFVFGPAEPGFGLSWRLAV